MNRWNRVKHKLNMNGQDLYKICKEDRNISESFKCIVTDNEVKVLIRNEKVFLHWFKHVLHSEFPMSFILFSTGEGNASAGHWLAVYFDVIGKCFFFDSYGDKPNKIFRRFCENIMVIAQDMFPRIHNHKQYKINEICREIQAHDTVVCGEYCIYFLHVINTCAKPEQAEYIIEQTFPKVIKTGRYASHRDKFNNYAQFYINDQFVKDWVQKNYNYTSVKSIIPKKIL